MERLVKAKIGTVIPIVKTLNTAENPINLFAKLSDYGRKKHCLLLESADIVDKYGELSIGTANPALQLSGFKEEFEIRALSKVGEEMIKFLKGDFKFCDKVSYQKDTIKGKLIPKRRAVSEDERLKLKTHMDIIRQVAFKFKPTEKPFIPYCGLFGAIAYDFIDQFEDLPDNQEDPLNDPDYLLYFVDNLFIIDHKADKTHFIVNALITHNKTDEIIKDVGKTMKMYEKSLTSKKPTAKKRPGKKPTLTTDTDREAFIKIVKKLKEHVNAGDIFQAVPSRTVTTTYTSEPLDIYTKLKELNPSPYLFYLHTGDGVLLGSSPETFLRVQGDHEKTAEIRTIAGTKPRGITDNKIDLDLDSRYETELKLDEKELAEHTMLIDLARNDIARITKPGSRYVDKPYTVEKYSHVQHMVSEVKGILKDDLDALHAYLATMNMGTLTGAPKIEAMKLIRQLEKNKRGFYGGSVGYLTPHGDFDSCIVIRSIRLKNNKAHVRAGAGIVYDSVPKTEFEETETKAEACLTALGVQK